jgi:hypothetical protein
VYISKHAFLKDYSPFERRIYDHVITIIMCLDNNIGICVLLYLISLPALPVPIINSNVSVTTKACF